MLDKKEVDVVVIGAGITGLTVAFQLIRKGLTVVVIEKQDRVGGQINSIRESGFIFESGPNTGVVSHPEVTELFQALYPDCKMDVAREEAKIRLIWKKGKFHALPAGLVAAVTTPLFSFSDKIRILFEPFRKKGTNPDESVGSLARRRLGKSFVDYAVDPFLSGVYAGDPERLITRFALPKLYNLEQNYGSFIRGAIKKASEPKSERDKLATKQVFSAEGGFDNLPASLTKAIGSENIKLSVSDIQLSQASDGWNVVLPSTNEAYHSRYIVSTIGAYALPSIFPFIEKEQMDPISSLHYAPIVQVGVGFNNIGKYGVNAFGGLVPSCEKQKILGILFPSAFFSNRSPQDGATLSFFIGGRRYPEYVNKPDNEIEALITHGLHNMLYIPTHIKPDIIKIFRHEYAIPQYEADSEQRLKSISQIEQQYPGLILAGNIRDGIGMADRIKQGCRIASSLI